VDDLKRAAREIDLWTSSCMVALEGDEPVGVLLATKRASAALVWRLGVHPAHLRRGHARHLLTSLGSKLAILGPSRMLAEVPERQGAACALFEACGFLRETRYVDYVRHLPAGGASPGGELAVPITPEELLACGAFERSGGRAWERSPATLLKRRASIRGLAVGSADRIEAWLLHEDTPAGRQLLGFGCADASRGETWLRLLVAGASRGAPGPLRWPRVAPDEVRADLLVEAGFEPTAVTLGFAGHARPA
jgi:hypothetical protein